MYFILFFSKKQAKIKTKISVKLFTEVFSIAKKVKGHICVEMLQSSSIRYSVKTERRGEVDKISGILVNVNVLLKHNCSGEKN